MKLKQLFEAKDGFEELLSETLPARAKFLIARIHKKLKEEIDTYYEKQQELFEEYGEKYVQFYNPINNDFQEIPKEDEEKFQKENSDYTRKEEVIKIPVVENQVKVNNELIELLDTDIELNVELIPISSFNNVNINGDSFSKIIDFLKE